MGDARIWRGEGGGCGDGDGDGDGGREGVVDEFVGVGMIRVLRLIQFDDPTA